MVYKSEARSPVLSSAATIARTTMPGSDLKPETMRLKVCFTTLPSAVLPEHTRQRQGYTESAPRLRCCRAVREAGMEGSSHPLLCTSGMEFSSLAMLSASIGRVEEMSFKARKGLLV